MNRNINSRWTCITYYGKRCYSLLVLFFLQWWILPQYHWDIDMAWIR